MAAKKGKGFATGHGVSEREKSRIGESNFANMPTEVKMEMYPKSGNRDVGELDDTMNEIDMTLDHSQGKRSKYMSNQH